MSNATAAQRRGIVLADRYAQLEFALWSALVGLSVADAATTAVALSVGFSELNPLVATLVEHVGLAGVVLVKGTYIVVAGAVDGTQRVYPLAAATVLSALIVANNLAWLLVLGSGPG